MVQMLGWSRADAARGFGEKPLLRPFIRHQVRRQKFQRHEAAQPRVFCFVNNTHPAAADFADDPVGADLLVSGGRLLCIAKRFRCQIRHRQIENAFRALMRDEQFLDFLIECCVALALTFGPVRPFFRGAVDRAVEYRRNVFPRGLFRHRENPWVFNCLPNTARCKARRALWSSPAEQSERLRPAVRLFLFR